MDHVVTKPRLTSVRGTPDFSLTQQLQHLFWRLRFFLPSSPLHNYDDCWNVQRLEHQEPSCLYWLYSKFAMDYILTSRKSSLGSRSSGHPTNKPTRRKQIYNIYPIYPVRLAISSRKLRIKPSTHQSLLIFYVLSRVSIVRSLVCGWLEGHWGLLSSLIERNTELEKLGDNGCEILEEKSLVLGIFFDPLLESLVRNKRHVGRKHH